MCSVNCCITVAKFASEERVTIASAHFRALTVNTRAITNTYQTLVLIVGLDYITLL